MAGFDSTAYRNLMKTYLYATSPTNDYTIAFSGLNALSQYGLYIYSQGDSASDNRRLGVTVNGVTYTTTAAVATASTFIENQNYLHVTGTADASGNLMITYRRVAGEANINGMQIETMNVPEPASILLLGIGGMVYGALRRREASRVSEV